MHCRLLILVCLIPFIICSPLLRKGILNQSDAKASYRLPTYIQPKHYTLRLYPDLVQADFVGNVEIQFVVINKTSKLVMHSKVEIDEGSVSVLDNEGNSVGPIKKTTVDPNSDFHIITLENKLIEGDVYTIKIAQFRGTLIQPGLMGFYIAKYMENGKEMFVHKPLLATTHFQPYGARLAFPCFDEPALKAKFNISLEVLQKYHVISNTEIRNELILNNGKKLVEFDETPLMSTYLVAFIVSEFASTKRVDRIKVFGEPALIKQGNGEFALNEGRSALKTLEDMFKIKYTLPKIDQAAIPAEYYKSGAMENWGLCTYRHDMLLSSSNSTTSTNMTIITAITHEFAHQWFGDLVSPKLWRYVWLSEGFATYFHYIAAAHFHPDYEFEDQHALINVQGAMKEDSSINTRSLSSDGPNLFDTITYSKGASITGMTEAFLTTPIFMDGLQIYLNKKKFSAADPSDLYESYQTSIDKKNRVKLPFRVKAILETWENNVGYPLVTAVRNNVTNKIELTQERFVTGATNNDTSVWYVPVTYATETQPSFHDTTTKFWLTKHKDEVEFNGLKSKEWFIINIQQKGYYRVNYDLENWYNIIDYLGTSNFSKIHRVNRAQLLDDSFALAEEGIISADIPLKLSSYLSQETDYVPLYTFFNHLPFIERIMLGLGHYEAFKTYVHRTLAGAYQYLGFDEKQMDKITDKMNRATVLGWLCEYNHADCLRKANSKLRRLKLKLESVAPDLKSQVYCQGIKGGTMEDWLYVYNKYLTTSDEDEKYILLKALPCSRNRDVIRQYCERGLNKIDGLDAEDVFNNIITSGSSVVINITFTYIKENYDRLKQIVNIHRLLLLISENLNTLDGLHEFEQLAAEHRKDQKLLESAIKTIKYNIEMIEKYKFTVDQFNSQTSLGFSTLYANVLLLAISAIMAFVTS